MMVLKIARFVHVQCGLKYFVISVYISANLNNLLSCKCSETNLHKLQNAEFTAIISCVHFNICVYKCASVCVCVCVYSL